MRILSISMQFGSYRSPSHECRVARVLAEMGHEVHLIVEQDPGWETPPPVNLTQTIMPLNERIANGQYDLGLGSDYDVGFASSASGGPFLAHWKQSTRKPVVVQLLDIPLWRLAWGNDAPWLNQWRPWFMAASAADALVVNANQTKSDLGEAARLYGVDGERLPTTQTVYYGIDTSIADLAQPLALTGVRADGIRACNVSRLVPYKGYEQAMMGLGLMHPQYRPEYVVVGRAEGNGEELRRLAQFGQLCDVHPYFAGPLSDADKFGVIRSCHFGLALAYNRHIPLQFPMEAVYCGLPVIVADTPINRERFTDKGVWYVNPWNTAEIAASIGEMVADLDGRRRAAAACKAWVAENRSFQSHAKGILHVLQGVAG